MPTIDSKQIVDMIISSGGYYASDPQVHSIVEYTNLWGGTCYGVNYGPHNAYERSLFVINPKTIFTRNEG